MNKLKYIVVTSFVCFFALLLSACGTNITLKINFNSNGGTTCNSIEFKGSNFKMPDDPTKDNYVFGGWFLDNGIWEEPFTTNTVLNYPLTKDMSLTVYAKWLEKLHIRFNSNGGSACNNMYLDKPGLSLPTPVRDGYEFKGWFLDNYTFAKQYTIDTLVENVQNNTIDVYAKWSSINQNEPVKTVYYQDNGDFKNQFIKDYDIIKSDNSILLYKPNILGQHFAGWYFDDALTNPVGEIMSYDMMSTNFITIYAKFIQKEVYNLSIVGDVQTLYQYGEPFNANSSKIKIEYLDKNFEDEYIDLTEDIISNFCTTDTVMKNANMIWGKEASDDSLTANFNVSINGVTLSTEYTVYTDIESFTVNQENLVFTHGESTYFKDRNISVSYTKTNGETGTEQLLEDDKGGVNYYIVKEGDLGLFIVTDFIINGQPYYRKNGLNVKKVGTFVANLRYHFRTIKVEYVVQSNEDIESGFVNVNSGQNIYLNCKHSLLTERISLYLNNEKTSSFLWEGITQEMIIEDIDTSSAGYKIAKINYFGKVINISYYVIDVQQVTRVELNKTRPYKVGENVTYTVSFKLTTSDGYGFNVYIESSEMITKIDTSTVGTKNLEFELQGRFFTVSYIVE